MKDKGAMIKQSRPNPKCSRQFHSEMVCPVVKMLGAVEGKYPAGLREADFLEIERKTQVGYYKWQKSTASQEYCLELQKFAACFNCDKMHTT